MLKPSRLAVVTVAATTLLLAGFSSSAAAAKPTAVVSATVAKSAAAIAAYWTPDRMRRAIPGDRLVADDFRRAQANGTLARQVEKGAPASVPAKAQPKSVPPVSHIGKVFMTFDGQDYVCSGNSVSSGNGDVVSTAGHCVKDGTGSWVSNFQFVPAYLNGNAPYGEWAAETVVTTSGWANSGDISYDGGFAVMATLNGQHLNSVVGASGVAFNQARGLSYTLYGYPAAPPFNGQTLETCSGTARQDNVGGTASQGVSCNMTGGSSGGPWFIGSGSGGQQNSVNSFGYNTVPNVMWGPYFGSQIQSAYNTASTS